MAAHSTQSIPKLYLIVGYCKAKQLLKYLIKHLSKIVAIVNNNIENKSNGIIVQCTEAWSSERGIISEVYTNPQCFIESEDVNNTKGVCSSKSNSYTQQKAHMCLVIQKKLQPSM